MTAPTQQGDDDLRYPANDPNPFRNEAAETVPVSELMKQVEQQADLAPVRLDVSIVIFIATFVGVIAGTVAEHTRDSDLLIWCGVLIANLLLVRWTRKR